jgi:hypothetical protein
MKKSEVENVKQMGPIYESFLKNIATILTRVALYIFMKNKQFSDAFSLLITNVFNQFFL